ncbi:hypothetical protein JTE90_007353 [Oedothorax gibbosus]|uniref:Glucose-methanol-choline oxidoreductase C-terminal domain-containing protein n=1 Tax=Oedothorax gibbosus TaxID=931172 RepID=A0AAV6TN38_9ARAC|nr:hypothetical protein JTE90_007353 [Oedothorax gibbosus]
MRDPKIPNYQEKLGNNANVEEYINKRTGVLAGVGANPLAHLPSKYTTLDYPDYQLNFVERNAPTPEFPIEMTADVIRKYFDFLPIVEGLKTCKAIGLSEPLKRLGSKLLDGAFPGCEASYGDEDKYFKCLAESFLSTLSHQVGTAKMGVPSDPTTVVTPRLK